MSEQYVSGVVEEPQAVLPPGTYFAQFRGFARKDGAIILQEKVSTFTDKNTGEQTQRKAVKMYWRFMVVTGDRAGVEVAGSTNTKGVEIIATPKGLVPRFKAPSQYAPNFTVWAEACGLDFAVDLSRFEIPVTMQTVLNRIERLLLEKAEQGRVVSVKIVETQDGGSWITWDGGVMAAPAEVAKMIKVQAGKPPTPRPSDPVTPVQAEQQRLAEYIRYMIGVAVKADAVDAASLQKTIQEMVDGWGVRRQRNIPVLNLLNTEQLHEVCDFVASVLESEGVEFEPLATPTEEAVEVPEPPEEPPDEWDML